MKLITNQVTLIMRKQMAAASLFGLCIWPLALTSLAAAESVTDVRIDIPYTKCVLTNALTLIVHEDHKAPIVAVNIWYHVGSKDEPPGRTGFAHLFEHLMFGATGGNQRGWFERLEAVGATGIN